MESIFTNNSSLFLIISSVNLFLIVILFLINLANRSKFKKLRSKYNKFMNGLSERNIEQLLDSHIEMVNEVKSKNRELEGHINYIDRNLLQCTQKMGIVRYNAFENVGSDLSFSVVLLDSNDNGVVISGIYSRDSSSTYAKPIIGGKSRYALSAEEIQALDTAKKMYGERLYVDTQK